MSDASSVEVTDLDLPRSRDLSGRAWKYTAKRAFAEFQADQVTDLAAALTYYAVFSLFPAVIAVVSLIGLVGGDPTTVQKMLDSVASVNPDAVDSIRGPLETLTQSSASGIGLVVGLLGALWSASGYVGAFGRALNRIYGVREGRPVWTLRPLQLLLTLVLLILITLTGAMMVVSGPVARTIGDFVGLGEQTVAIWDWVKLPVIAILVVLIIALLYWGTPNIKQPSLRWVTPGAALAFLVWILASVAFGFYVGNFGSYNKTYGALAGVIIFLLWLWLTNVALLFGAEFDSELDRARQLSAGIKAEDNLVVELRDDKGVVKHEEKVDNLELQGRDLRREEGHPARAEGGADHAETKDAVQENPDAADKK